MGQQVTNIVALILKAVALAMGIAVVILNILGEVAIETAVTLLGLGLLAIVLVSFLGGKEVE